MPAAKHKSLVIVESPTKAKTIGRFLGGEFLVTSSMGHIRDLPEKKLGVDVDKEFKPQYVIPAKAKKTVSELKKKAESASEVILATDEDREGEAIAWHLEQALGLDKDNKSKTDVKRIVFHEITKNAIADALAHPRAIDKHLVDAQQARRILDRLVGYELSPFLWKKIMRGLSAGRVQSVAVRLIVEREQEIKSFKPQEYWNIYVELEPEKGEKNRFRARLQAINGKALKKFDITTEKQARQLASDLDGAGYKVAEIKKKEVKRNPAPPFTTSTLQQECARKFGYSAKQTMMIAQQLYEGIELGEEVSVGLITYMRTDAVNLAEEALASIRAQIESIYGTDYTLPEPRRYSSKSKNAQEAHEAVRPTDASRTPENVKEYLDARQYKIYSLIWMRTLASQMPEAVFDQTTIDIQAATKDGKKEYNLRATGQIMKFDGFIKVYEEGKDEKEEEELVDKLPDVDEGERLKHIATEPKQSFTEPPPRYTDATLIKALEEHGIGRPSTYAPIISTILDRKYVERKDKRFYPTEIGATVTNMLKEHFEQIVDVNFTAQMEEELDEIANGKRAWQPMISEFYQPFKKRLEEKTNSVEKHVEKTDVPCPTCGKTMIIRYGRFGKFMACSDYPACKTTQPLPEEQKKEEDLNNEYKNEKCPECGKAMVVRRGRFGHFLGCSDYPTCKGIKKIEKKSGVRCPQCKQGDVVQKKNKRGSFFYACNRYPDCDWTGNKLPEEEKEEKK